MADGMMKNGKGEHDQVGCSIVQTICSKIPIYLEVDEIEICFITMYSLEEL